MVQQGSKPATHVDTTPNTPQQLKSSSAVHKTQKTVLGFTGHPVE